jgi:hypothetical protein
MTFKIRIKNLQNYKGTKLKYDLHDFRLSIG